MNQVSKVTAILKYNTWLELHPHITEKSFSFIKWMHLGVEVSGLKCPNFIVPHMDSV